MPINLKRLFCLAPLLMAVANNRPICAQSNTSSVTSSGTSSVTSSGTLFKTIAALDAKLFDAYNHCDLATLAAMVSDDLEFYHDQTGLSVGKDPFLAAIQQNICGKVERSLVALEVYPLNGYGAVETGVHHFSHPGHPEEGGGDAKFITLWQNKDGSWKVTRVISYDHAPSKK